MYTKHTIKHILQNLLNYKVCKSCNQLNLQQNDTCHCCDNSIFLTKEEDLLDYIALQEFVLIDQYLSSTEKFLNHNIVVEN